MWIMTRCGFFSAVVGKTEGGKLAPNTILLRARRRSHLLALQKAYREYAGGYLIHETEHTDYRYRLAMDRSDWLGLCNAVAADVTYSNFKDSIDDGPLNALPNGNAEAHEFHDACMKVWNVMYGMQPPADDPHPTPRTGDTRGNAKKGRRSSK